MTPAGCVTSGDFVRHEVLDGVEFVTCSVCKGRGRFDPAAEAVLVVHAQTCRLLPQYLALAKPLFLHRAGRLVELLATTSAGLQ